MRHPVSSPPNQNSGRTCQYPQQSPYSNRNDQYHCNPISEQSNVGAIQCRCNPMSVQSNVGAMMSPLLSDKRDNSPVRPLHRRLFSTAQSLRRQNHCQSHCNVDEIRAAPQNCPCTNPPSAPLIAIPCFSGVTIQGHLFNKQSNGVFNHCSVEIQCSDCTKGQHDKTRDSTKGTSY